MTPFKALLVEGTSGVGQSTLIDALLRRHVASSAPRKIRSLMHLAQSHTYGPLARAEDARTLTVAQNLAHLDRIVGTVEWFHASVQEHDRPWAYAILDTLHLTHCVRPGVVNWPDVAEIDARLAALGSKLLFLEAAPPKSGTVASNRAGKLDCCASTPQNSDATSIRSTPTSSASKKSCFSTSKFQRCQRCSFAQATRRKPFETLAFAFGTESIRDNC